MSNSIEKSSKSVATPTTTDLVKLSDTRRVARIGLWTLALGFGSFIGWAAFASLDQGVPTFGTVSVDTKRKVVQHLQGGIVREVLVGEGQMVALDEPLMRLSDSSTRASYESVRQQFFSLQAVESRLIAELQRLPKVTFDPDLLKASVIDPKLREHMVIQSQLLQSRRRSLDAQLSALRENIRAQESLIVSTGQIAANLIVQRDLLEKEIVGVRELAREGYLPMSRQMEMERMLASVRSQVSENASNEIRARQSVLELRQREIIVQADYQKEVEQLLSQLLPEIQAQAERFKALNEDLDRTVIKSPAAGQVVGLSVQTVGSVISPGQRIMEIVPKDEALVIEAKVETQLIDRIKQGDPVDLRFSAFANSPQLVVSGVLRSLSSDSLTDAAPNGAAMPYYLARVEVTPEGLKTLGSRKLQPGMPVEAIIKTGRRTMLEYILHPLTKRMAASLKEE
jgi:protease secretion system membrane fusion protein